MSRGVSGTGSVSARDYAPRDRDACLAVFDSNVPEFFTPEERTPFAEFIDDLPGRYLVLEDVGGRIVACGGWAVETGSRTADLCWGMVARDLHGTGLGRALTRLRLDDVRRVGGLDAVSLHTSQHTTGFYERLGFTLVEVTEDGLAPGLDRCDMRLAL